MKNRLIAMADWFRSIYNLIDFIDASPHYFPAIEKLGIHNSVFREVLHEIFNFKSQRCQGFLKVAAIDPIGERSFPGIGVGIPMVFRLHQMDIFGRVGGVDDLNTDEGILALAAVRYGKKVNASRPQYAMNLPMRLKIQADMFHDVAGDNDIEGLIVKS